MRVGIDTLDFAALRRKRVGLLSHQAALARGGADSASLLHAKLGRKLVALFGPEHGFFGQAGAGEHTAEGIHPDWGIPVHSLYGEHRKPTPAMLKGIDVLVCDLQDIGVRCYTYLATLKNVLEACAENGIEVIVADRPVPHRSPDGPMLDPRFTGFVAPLNVPMVHAMTPCGIARFIKHHLLPELKLTCADLRGARGKGWERPADAPSFIPPSPGIRSWETALVYPATVFCEALPQIDCGRGNNMAFRVFSVPGVSGSDLCRTLNGCGIEGAAFYPYYYEKEGARIAVTDAAAFRPVAVSVAILAALREFDPDLWNRDGVRREWFDKLYGTDAVRLALEAGESAAAIAESWKGGLNEFRAALEAAQK